MALNVAKTTLSIVQGQYGWTESYYSPSPSSDLQVELVKGGQLAQKRAACSGAQTNVNYVKVSNEQVKRDVVVANASYQGAQSTPSDAPDTALLIYRSGSVPGTSAPLYMRGVWDALITDGGQIDLSNAPWFAAFNSYGGFLATGYGFLAKDPATSIVQPIGAVTQNLNGTVHVITLSTLFSAPYGVTREKVFVSGVQGALSVNGSLIVVPAASNAFDTIDRIPIFPYTSGGRVTFNQLQFVPIETLQLRRVVERKVGRPLYVSRGRRRGRKLG